MDRCLDEQINSNLPDTYKYVYICILQKHCAIYDIAWCIHDISWYVHLSIYDKTNIGRQTSRTESFFPFPFWEDCSRVPPSVRFRPHGGFVGIELVDSGHVQDIPRTNSWRFPNKPLFDAVFFYIWVNTTCNTRWKNMQNITKPTEVWTKTLKMLTRVTSTHLFWPVSYKFDKSCYTSIS